MRFVYKDDLQVPNTANMKALMNSWDAGIREVCLTGGRGKGKTVAVWLYLLFLVRFVPGIKIVVARSAYSDIAGSFVATCQDRIFKYPLGDSRWRHPKNPFFLSGGVDAPKVMRFLNGSEIRFVGLQDPNNRRGIECDVFLLNEGTLEETSEVWGTMGATLSGGRRGGFRVRGERFSQMLTDTNPSHKFHWIYKHFHPFENEDTLLDESLWLPWTHHDNPALIEDSGSLNAIGEQTILDLQRVYGTDGFEAMRMIWGVWCNAEGAVYSMWDPAVHVERMSRDDFPSGTRWHIGIDHGGGPAPFAVGLTGQTDRTFRTFKEMSMSRCTIDEVIARLDTNLERWGVPKSLIETVWPDTAIPSFNMSLKQAGYPVMDKEKVDKDIKGGIDSVKQIIGDNRFYVNATSLEERCGFYEGPQGFKEEALAYSYLPVEKQVLAAEPDKPVDRYNHWCDLTRYKLHGLRENVLEARRTGFVARFSS